MINVWGSNPSDINPAEFCQFCEREIPFHYNNCPTRKENAVTITVYVPVNDSFPYAVLSESDAHNAYDEFLDEIHEPIHIAGTVIYPSRALKECDPIAYRTGFNDWTDSEYYEFEMPDELFGAGDAMDEWIDRAIEGRD